MVDLSSYYQLRDSKPSRAIVERGPQLTLSKAKRLTDEKENRHEKRRFIRRLKAERGPDITLFYQIKAELGDQWLNNGKPLLVRHIKQVWEIETLSGMAPVARIRANLTDAMERQMLAIGAQPLPRHAMNLCRMMFDEAISRQMAFFAANRDTPLAQQHAQAIAQHTIHNEHHRHTDLLKYHLLMSLDLPKDVIRLIGTMMLSFKAHSYGIYHRADQLAADYDMY